MNCPTGKTTFGTQQAAELAGTIPGYRAEVYRCANCTRWHLGSPRPVTPLYRRGKRR
jgi:hypothetical protein